MRNAQLHLTWKSWYLKKQGDKCLMCHLKNARLHLAWNFKNFKNNFNNKGTNLQCHQYQRYFSNITFALQRSKVFWISGKPIVPPLSSSRSLLVMVMMRKMMIKFMIITKSLFHDDHDHNYDVYDHNRAMAPLSSSRSLSSIMIIIYWGRWETALQSFLSLIVQALKKLNLTWKQAMLQRSQSLWRGNTRHGKNQRQRQTKTQR